MSSGEGEASAPAAVALPAPPLLPAPPAAPVEASSPDDAGGPVLARRWRGQKGRLEVVYVTLSDPSSGTGLWVHHEMVAPEEGAAFTHGWCALFRPSEDPLLERFAGGPVGEATGSRWPAAGGAELEPPVLRGQAGRLGWDLAWEEPEAPPLFTFPALAWEKELLPGAQVLAVPSARFAGSVSVDGRPFALSPQATGAVAHIYGHGNAERWGWLHADLGGGDVLEVVAATSRMPGMAHLPPLPFVQLRVAGRDWPRHPIAAAPLLHARLGLPQWELKGTVGRWRLRAEVVIPPSQSVSLGYVDPDGSTATCTNSEVADAEIVLEHRRSRWETAASWSLRGTAHAEIGTRP